MLGKGLAQSSPLHQAIAGAGKKAPLSHLLPQKQLPGDDEVGGAAGQWAGPPHSLGLMDSRGTVMLASESSGCCGGPEGSGDPVWRLAARELGELQLLLFCRSRSVSRGAGCCFSLIGGQCVDR